MAFIQMAVQGGQELEFGFHTTNAVLVYLQDMTDKDLEYCYM